MHGYMNVKCECLLYMLVKTCEGLVYLLAQNMRMSSGYVDPNMRKSCGYVDSNTPLLVLSQTSLLNLHKQPT